MLASTYCGQPYCGQGAPTATYWGVDSAPRADSPAGDTLYDRLVLVDQANRKPSFWGRYIGGNFELTPPEAQFLHDRNIRIFLIYNGTTELKVEEQDPTIARQNGVDAATAAIARARDYLRVPRGIPRGRKQVWIYCNIEFEWNPTKEFFQGWFDTMFASPYGGGVYCATDRALHWDPYCAAYSSRPVEMQNDRALLFTLQKLQCSNVDPVPPIPYCSERGTSYKSNWAHNPPAFSEAVIPPCGAPVVIYQYALNFTIVLQEKAVDYDLANTKGFERMWAPPAWEAYRAFDDGGEEVSLTYPAMVRCMDELADGRLVITFVTQRPTGNFLHTLISDDFGLTWTAKEAFNLRVTAISGDTFTIMRTQEGSTARAIVVGDQIAATITAKTLTDVEERLIWAQFWEAFDNNSDPVDKLIQSGAYRLFVFFSSHNANSWKAATNAVYTVPTGKKLIVLSRGAAHAIIGDTTNRQARFRNVTDSADMLPPVSFQGAGAYGLPWGGDLSEPSKMMEVVREGVFPPSRTLPRGGSTHLHQRNENGPTLRIRSHFAGAGRGI